MSKPTLFLPATLTAILGIVFISFVRSSLLTSYSLYLPFLAVSFIVGLFIQAAYPVMVKTIVNEGHLSMRQAYTRVYHRFWSVLAASILVWLIIALGAFALLFPGLWFFTWYAYTIPAIMLEDKGALEGMSASKAFGHDKKMSTILLAIVVAIVYIPGIALFALFTLSGSPVLGQLSEEVFTVPTITWALVLFSYVYITRGPSSVHLAMGSPNVRKSTATTPQPTILPSQESWQNFCGSCGTRLQAGARFCQACGKPI